jgi:HK97 family phage prohead protease
MKTKTVATGIKDLDDKNGVVVFYASIFDIIDADNDIVKKTAFNRSLSDNSHKKRIKHLLQHDRTKILSKPRFEVDDTGLLVTSEIITTTFGSDTIKLYAKGALDEHSIGYDVIEFNKVQEDTEKPPIYELTELKLWEVSSVTWGSQAKAELVDFKDWANGDFTTLFKKLDKLKKAYEINDLTDDMYFFIEKNITNLIKIKEICEQLITFEKPEKIPEAKGVNIDNIINALK